MRRTWILLPAMVALLLAWPFLVQASRHHADTASSPGGQSGGSALPTPAASATASASAAMVMTIAASPSTAPSAVVTSVRPKKAAPTQVRPPTTRPTAAPAAAAHPTSAAPTTHATTAALTTKPAPTTPAAPTTKATPTPKPKPRPKPKPTHAPKPLATPTKPPLTGGTVTIGNFQYAMPSHVSPGARIAIYNADSVAHTLTIGSAGIDVVVAGNAGGYLTAPTTPGHYLVTCDYHADMTATLIVS